MTEVQKRASEKMNYFERMNFFKDREEVITLEKSFSGHPVGSKGVIVERCSDGTCLVSFDGGKTDIWNHPNCVWMSYLDLEKIVDDTVADDAVSATPVVKQKKYRKITREELLDLKVGQKVKVEDDDGAVIKGEVIYIDTVSPDGGKYRIQLTSKLGDKYNIWFYDTGVSNIGVQKIVKIKI